MKSQYIRLVGSEQIKPKIIEMFNDVEYYVDMTTCLYPKFYNDNAVRNALENCIKRVVKFRLLIDGRVDIENLKKEVSWIFDLNKKFPLYIAVAKKPVKHVIVADDKYVRLEESHSITEEVENIKNVLIKNPPWYIVEAAKELFEEYWRSSMVIK
jgi:hypothetical protein